MIPPSTKSAPVALTICATFFVVSGLMALRSTKTVLRAVRARAGERRSANESASAGGTIESRKSALLNSSSLTGFMPAFAARSALAAPRPERLVRTSRPFSTSRDAVAAPIAPWDMMEMIGFIFPLSISRDPSRVANVQLASTLWPVSGKSFITGRL